MQCAYIENNNNKRSVNYWPANLSRMEIKDCTGCGE